MILDSVKSRWRTVHESQLAKVGERERLRRRWLPFLVVAMVCVAVASSLLTIWALSERSEAQSAREEANSRQLATMARQQLRTKPELGILLAREAIERPDEPPREAVDALRTALGNYRGRGVLSGHTGPLGDIDFSPGGSRIVTASADGTARVWGATTGRMLGSLEGHRGAVYSARFSPDGQRIVTAGADGTVRVWDPNSATTVSVRRGPGGALTEARFSPDGAQIISPADDGRTMIWDVDGGAPTAVLVGHRDFVGSAEFDSEGRRAVTAGDDGTARVWNADTGRLLRVFRHGASVSVARFDPDGSRVVTAGADGRARVWEVASGRSLALGQARKVGREPAPVNDARFSADGSEVVTASEDKKAQIWNVDTGRLEVELDGHEGGVETAAFSPDGRTVVTGSEDGTAATWAVATGRRLTVVEGHRQGVDLAAFSPEPSANLVVTAGSDGTARLSDATDEPAAVLRQPDEVSTSVFDAEGDQLVTATSDEKVRIWDWRADGETPRLTIQEEGPVRTAAIDRGGGLVVAAAGNEYGSSPRTRIARIFSARTGALSGKPLIGHERDVTAASFSPDGKRVVTASADETARVWSVETREQLRVLRGHNGPLSDAQFSRDGRWVVTAGLDGVARVWDAASGRPVEALRLSPLATDDPLAAYAEEGMITATFDAESRRVATASLDGTAQLWTISSGARRNLAGHAGAVTSATINPDGRTVATSSMDGSVRIWDRATARSLTMIQVSDRSVWNVAFSPDGRWLTTAGADGTVRVYPCEVCGSVDGLVKAAESRVKRSLSAREEKRYLPE